jgi:uncharacterized protein (DUF2236 family)
LFPTETELDEILVGPESVSWRITSDTRLNAVMLYPLLLQVAHPTVSAGVMDFSEFERRPWERLLRTLDYASLLVYGGREAAMAGRRLRVLHRRFKGRRPDGGRYTALEPAAYAWVHATLLESYVAGHAHVGRRLSLAETQRFYREYRGLGRLIGVRERDLPPDWAGFRDYFARTSESELTRTEAVDRVLRAIGSTPPPRPLPGLVWRALRIPGRRLVWLGGVGLMTPELRRRLGISWNLIDEAQFQAMGALLRPLTPLLPGSFTITGPDQLRARREAIAAGPLGEGGP